MNNTEETTTVETSTEEEAAPDQTPTKKDGCKKAARTSKGARTRKRRQRGIEPATKKITTAAAESRKKSRSRDGSKAKAVLELLRRKDGAAVAEIAKATGWQNHTIRAFVSAHFVAFWMPVRRATRIDATAALRHD